MGLEVRHETSELCMGQLYLMNMMGWLEVRLMYTSTMAGASRLRQWTVTDESCFPILHIAVAVHPRAVSVVLSSCAAYPHRGLPSRYYDISNTVAGLHTELVSGNSLISRYPIKDTGLFLGILSNHMILASDNHGLHRHTPGPFTANFIDDTCLQRITGMIQ